MNLSDITTIREQVLAITERLDAIESESKETITPEVFEQKLLNVFKAGLFAGRLEQHKETCESFRHASAYVDLDAGDLSVSGSIDYDDLGVTEKIENTDLGQEWTEVIVDMARIDRAISKFKPEAEESNNETPES